MKFIFQSPHSWSGVRQRPHHLALGFARAGHEVLWIEPRYVKWIVTERARWRSARAEHPAERIEVRPVTLASGERIGPVREFNRRRLREAARLPSVSGQPVILWLYNPHEAHLADSVPADLVVYDIMDEYSAFPWAPRGVEAEERRLLARADLVFAGTDRLCRAKMRMHTGGIECLLSGVDVAHFDPSRDDLPPVDTATAAFRRRHARIIGCAGTLDMRTDEELIAEIARRRPEFGWLLVGPVVGDHSRLRALPNVRFTGPVTWDALPAYYRIMDCATVPFVESELTRHVNPTKILEYAAAGLPVVSRALPDVERFYSDSAFLYRDVDAADLWFKMILEGETPPAQRPEVAPRLRAGARICGGRSWESVSRAMLDSVERRLKERSERQ